MTNVSFYTEECKDVTIGICPAKDCFEVYYRKPHYAFRFAFGIPYESGLDETLALAKANIENYSDLFDEEDEE